MGGQSCIPSRGGPVGKLTSFRHQNDNGPDVNKLSFFDLV